MRRPRHPPADDAAGEDVDDEGHVERRHYFSAPMQALLAFTRSGTFAGRAAHMGGYDVAENGAVAFDF